MGEMGQIDSFVVFRAYTAAKDWVYFNIQGKDVYIKKQTSWNNQWSRCNHGGRGEG